MLKVYFGHTSLVEDPEVFIRSLEMVKENRREKVLALKQLEDRKRSLLAGVLLKQAMEKEGLEYEALEFGLSPEGKPYLMTGPKLYFSLSHAGDYAACVLSDKPVGVDIESTSRVVFQPGKMEKLDAMAKKCLSEKEMEIYMAADKAEKRDLFVTYWTRKEAFSKAVGKGMGLDFAAIDTEADIAYFQSDWVKEGYMLSICMMN